MNLQGKVALVIGGGSGIGAAIARRLAADGARLCIAGRREEYLDQVAGSLPPGTAVKCPGDVSRSADIERMVAAALTLSGRIDVLVNCAAMSSPGSITGCDPGEWRQTVEVNLVAPFFLMRAVIPHMIAGGGGSIVNIASLAGLRCVPETSAYAASKAGLIMLTQQAALDYGCHKIRCNVVCPGFVYTAMTEAPFGELARSVGADTRTLIERAFTDIPLREPATADKIAGICSFLAGDDSSYMTGVVIPMDGGTAIVDAFGPAVQRAAGEIGRGR